MAISAISNDSSSGCAVVDSRKDMTVNIDHHARRISEECRWEQPIRKRGHASSNRCEVRVNRLARAFPVPGFAVVPQRQRVIIRTPVPSPAVTRSWISHAGIGCIKISAKRVRIFAGIFARIFPRIFPETFSDARNRRFRAQHARDLPIPKPRTEWREWRTSRNRKGCNSHLHPGPRFSALDAVVAATRTTTAAGRENRKR